ncbi:hypothetical protein [Salinibaculum salinum]|uniref:hypothetical protein n=1 Tax=Salinibaculum salinum TaxID=3131996 RepID=UPI0030EEE19F
MSSDKPPEFDELLPDTSGKYSCPICHDFEADEKDQVKAHISGSQDEQHDDLGWNYESEIAATAETE